MSTEMRKSLNGKLLALGIDALDPRFARRCVDKGIMPNLKKFMERGACREDLVMLGGHPTVTPPMWTTMATGCYANVHGITGFYRKSDTGNLDTIEYNLDSRLCKAEPLWNVSAEAGLKTLVWHWPGSAWPPTSDSENLYVVDGTSPGSVGMAVAQCDTEFLLGGNKDFTEVTFKTKAATGSVAPCVVTDLDLDDQEADSPGLAGVAASKDGLKNLITNASMQGHTITELALDMVQTPIKSASGWVAAPEDALEMTLLLSGGLIRRPCLLLKNDAGEYDHVAIYKNKKATEPIAIVHKEKMAVEVVDEAIQNDMHIRANRNMKILDMAPDGSTISMWISAAMDMDNDSAWHPKRLFKEVTENCGYPTPTSMIGHQDPKLITDCMLANWYATMDWQIASLHYLIENEGIEVIFSHMHSVDLQMHMFIKHLATTRTDIENRLPHEEYVKFAEDVYKQADYYIGKFMHLLDEGWTIMIMSDHGQVAPKHNMPFWGEISGVNIVGMEEMGYTVMKCDENGNKLPEIDWTKTRAVAQREGHIYINLKGREKTGIVDPKDKYELEEQIMTDMYAQRDPQTGKRVIALALRNRDAVLLGQGGPDAGDICYWNAEGYNYDHGDSLSTCWGEEDTSSSPIFVAAGLGIKENYVTDRIIRQIDFAPTIAAILGVRMPAQCEGAPAYQILSEEF